MCFTFFVTDCVTLDQLLPAHCSRCPRAFLPMLTDLLLLYSPADQRELGPVGQAMLETVVERLVGLPEGDHVIDHRFRLDSLDQDARDEISDGLHLGLAEAKGDDPDVGHAQPPPASPILRC